MVSRAVFDTNIIIDYLAGHPVAAALLDTMDDGVISLMTYMEVMVGIRRDDTIALRDALRLFDTLQIVGIDEVSTVAVAVRQETHDKFPDAIVHATALKLGLPLYTRDKKIRSLTSTPDIVICRPYDDQDPPQLTAAMISGIRMDTFSAQDFNRWRESVIQHLARPGEPLTDL